MPELLFLGTCAHDYSPKLQAEFRNCFDLDARRSSSALLCGHILIDCGDHTLESLRIAGIETSEITDLVLTHLHGDHFNADNVRILASGRMEPLRLWCSEEAKLPEIPCEIRRMEKGVSYALSDTVSVTGLSANHDANVFPQHLYFEADGRKLLYATDGAWMLNATYAFLRKKELDALVIDCTTGDYEGEWRMAEHNSIPMLRVMLPCLRTARITTENTAVYATHLAPSLHKPHAETETVLNGIGARAAYDGLKIDI